MILGGKIHSSLPISTISQDGSAAEMEPLPKLLEMLDSMISKQLIMVKLVLKYLSLMSLVKDVLRSTVL